MTKPDATGGVSAEAPSRTVAARGQRIDFPRIDAFGDGGFRVGGDRHEGSLLILNGAVQPWTGVEAGLSLTAFEPIFAATPTPELVLLGTGARMRPPPEVVAHALRSRAMGLEFMATATACRVYGDLIGQGRLVAAALIAV